MHDLLNARIQRVAKQLNTTPSKLIDQIVEDYLNIVEGDNSLLIENNNDHLKIEFRFNKHLEIEEMK